MPIEFDYFLLSPILVFIFIYYIFYIVLKKLESNVLSDIGFIYLGFFLLYTIGPAWHYFFITIDKWDPLFYLNLKPEQVSNYLWLHVVFILSFSIGYLFSRGKNSGGIPILKQYSSDNNRSTIILLLLLLATCYLFLIGLSNEVSNYYESYIRYDDLSWENRKFVSILIRFKLGIYAALLTFLFMRFQRFRLSIFILLILILSYEIIFSYGARIQAFIILTQCLFLYNLVVKKIQIKILITISILVMFGFSMIELVRLLTYDQTQDFLSENGLRLPLEFNSVFYTGYHLYNVRWIGIMPPHEFQMFFYDLISLVPFVDFQEWNPMEWYFRNYYPDALVAPFTLGPIADSAIWGGILDLFMRGFVNGLFFALILRWFLAYRSNWWAISVYTFCCASSIMSLKYSIFYLLNPLLKTILPLFLIIAIYRIIVSKFDIKFKVN